MCLLESNENILIPYIFAKRNPSVPEFDCSSFLGLLAWMTIFSVAWALHFLTISYNIQHRTASITHVPAEQLLLSEMLP